MSRGWCWLVLGVLGLMGVSCLPMTAISPPPTVIGIAKLPVVNPLAVANTTVPPTFTPSIPDTPLPPTAVMPTVPPPPTPLNLPTWTPTAVVEPQFEATVAANAPFLDVPPSVTECGQNGMLFRSRFPSAVGGPWRNYHIYLPPCYGDDGRVYPVLYLFHGSIQLDSHWADLGLVRYLDQKISNGRYAPFIVVMPFNGVEGNTTSGNTHSIEGITVDALIPTIDSTYCTWDAAEGRAIGGISRGGYWALMLAFRHPELFTAVAGHSSHLRLETDSETYNPLATYATADLSHMRIWMDWGETDFLRTGQQTLQRSLESVGANLTTTVYPGGHNEAYWMTHLEAYLDWYAAEWPLDRQLYPPCTR